MAPIEARMPRSKQRLAKTVRYSLLAKVAGCLASAEMGTS
jgi:hypothetical protein